MSKQFAAGGQKKKIFVLGWGLLIFYLFLAMMTGLNYAAASDEPIKMNFQVVIPGLSKTIPIDQNSISQYISAIFDFATYGAIILAVVVMMVGGFLWLTSGGNQERAGNGKAYIASALSGLVLVMFSITLLNFVNPDLVKLKPIPVYKTGEIANCCAANTGPFSGFQIKESGVIKNTCNVPADQKLEYEKTYGTITDCGNNKTCGKFTKETTFSCKSNVPGCCLIKDKPGNGRVCYDNTTEIQCDNYLSHELGTTWTKELSIGKYCEELKQPAGPSFYKCRLKDDNK